MIITQPPANFTLLFTIVPNGIPGAFATMIGLSSAYTSYLLIGEQMFFDTDSNLMLRLVDDLGGVGNFTGNGSCSQFAAGVETIAVYTGQSQFQLSDTWNTAAVSKGGVRIWFDNLLVARTAGNDRHPSFMGIGAIPKTAPSDCTLTDKFSGSITNANPARMISAIRLYPSAGLMGGGFKLYGMN